MSEYRVNDLATVASLPQVIFSVTDPGMGKPRGQMELKALVGIKRLTGVSECLLGRPPIKKGDWVRRVESSHRARVLAISAHKVSFDQVEEGGLFENKLTTAHPMYWVPCETPKEFAHERTMKEQHSKEMRFMREEANRLAAANSACRSEIDKLAREGDRLRERVVSREAKIAALEGRLEAGLGKQDVKYLKSVNSGLRSKVTALTAENSALRVGDNMKIDSLSRELEEAHKQVMMATNGKFCAYEAQKAAWVETDRCRKEFIASREEIIALKQEQERHIVIETKLRNEKNGETMNINAIRIGHTATIAQRDMLSKDLRAARSDLDFVRVLAKNAEKEKKDAHKALVRAMGQRGGERAELERTRRQVKKLELEILALRRQQVARPEIVM